MHKKVDPLKYPLIYVNLTLGSSECFKLMIRKVAQDLTNLGILGGFVGFPYVQNIVFFVRSIKSYQITVIQQIAVYLNCCYLKGFTFY